MNRHRWRIPRRLRALIHLMSEPTTMSTEHTAPHNAEQAVNRAPQAAADLGTVVARQAPAMNTPAISSASTSSLGAPASSVALRAIDQALADDLDSLLDGDFETIDAVLHGASHSPAANAVEAEAQRSEAPAPPAQVVATSQVSLPDADMEDVQTVTQTTAPSPAAPVVAKVDQTKVASPSGQSPQSEKPAHATTPGAKTATESAPSQAKPIVARSAETPESDDAEVPSQNTLQRLRQAIVNVLILVNFPLRLIPARLKPAVDWIALSLLVWVPIVWVMALVIGPRAVVAHAELAASHEGAAMHSESTNTAKSEHGTSSGGHASSGKSSGKSSGGSSGGHGEKKSSGGGHDAGKSSAKSKAKAPTTRAAGNKLPTDKKGSSKSKSKDAAKGSAEHH